MRININIKSEQGEDKYLTFDKVQEYHNPDEGREFIRIIHHSNNGSLVKSFIRTDEIISMSVFN